MNLNRRYVELVMRHKPLTVDSCLIKCPTGEIQIAFGCFTGMMELARRPYRLLQPRIGCESLGLEQ